MPDMTAAPLVEALRERGFDLLQETPDYQFWNHGDVAVIWEPELVRVAGKYFTQTPGQRAIFFGNWPAIVILAAVDAALKESKSNGSPRFPRA